jgi:hypothetical protein
MKTASARQRGQSRLRRTMGSLEMLVLPMMLRGSCREAPRRPGGGHDGAGGGAGRRAGERRHRGGARAHAAARVRGPGGGRRAEPGGQGGGADRRRRRRAGRRVPPGGRSDGGGRGGAPVSGRQRAGPDRPPGRPQLAAQRHRRGRRGGLLDPPRPAARPRRRLPARLHRPAGDHPAHPGPVRLRVGAVARRPSHQGPGRGHRRPPARRAGAALRPVPARPCSQRHPVGGRQRRRGGPRRRHHGRLRPSRSRGPVRTAAT